MPRRPKPPATKTPAVPIYSPGVNVSGQNVDTSRLNTYNRRGAEANAQRQDAALVTPKLEARQDMLQRQRQDLQKDFNSGLINKEEFDSRNTLITQGALRTGEALQNANGDLTQAEQFLGVRDTNSGLRGPETLTIDDDPFGNRRSAAGVAANQAANQSLAGGANRATAMTAGRTAARVAIPQQATTPIGENVSTETRSQINADNAAITAANEQAKNAVLQREQMKQDADMASKGVTNTPTAPTTTPQTTEPPQTPTGSSLERLKALVANDPEMAQFLPQIEELTQRQGNPEADRDAALEDFDSTDKDGDGVTDGVQESVSELNQSLLDEKAKSEGVIQENKQIALDAAKLQKEMAEIAQKKFQLKQVQVENEQRDANIESEIRNRRAAARMGITSDTNGLKWMGEEIRKGTQALTFLQQMGSLQEAEFALQTGTAYNLSVRSALNEHSANQLQIDSQYNQQVNELKKVVSLDAKERRVEKAKINEKYWERKDKEDERTWGLMKDITLKMMDSVNQRRKDAAGEVIKTGDSLKFLSDIKGRIELNPIIKQAQQVGLDYGALDAAWTQSRREAAQLKVDPNSTSRFASDQALITKFNKILDPTSVVRESEYARSLEGGTLIDQLYGATKKYLTEGGSGLTDTQRKELFEVATKVKESYDQQTLKKVQGYLMEVDMFNSQPSLQRPLQYKEVIDLDIPLPEQHYGEMEGLYSATSYDSTGTENTDRIAGWLPDIPGGRRTDRHNNPTAFTIDIARQAGLQEGVDYVVGDPFQGGVTAKLLGDPIAQSIKVIDKIGFYTQGNRNRWTHTAMKKGDWESLTYDQKQRVIIQMYQREGGTGVLAQGVGTQIASAPQAADSQGFTLKADTYGPSPEKLPPKPLPVNTGKIQQFRSVS